MTCGAVGGDFFSLPTGQYGCSNICAQASVSCVVTCGGDGKCFGECPRCGRIASPNRTRLSGADVVTRILNSLTTARTGGPGYGYGPGPYPDAVIVNPITGRRIERLPNLLDTIASKASIRPYDALRRLDTTWRP